MTYKIRLSGRDDQGRRVYNVIDEQGNVIYSANYYYTQKFLEFMTGGVKSWQRRKQQAGEGMRFMLTNG